MGRIYDIATELGKLVEEKNAAYGSAFQRTGVLLRELYPNGVKPDQYVDLLITTRIMDKLFRIANRKNAFGESPYNDIAGYGILGRLNDDEDAADGIAVLAEPPLHPRWQDDVKDLLGYQELLEEQHHPV